MLFQINKKVLFFLKRKGCMCVVGWGMPITVLIIAIVISAHTHDQLYFQPDNFNSCNDEKELILLAESSFTQN